MTIEKRLRYGTWARCEECGHIQLVWDEGCESCASMNWSFDTLDEDPGEALCDGSGEIPSS